MNSRLLLHCALAALLSGLALSAFGSTKFGPGGRFPQMQTRAIAYDSRGVLWWGTEDELIRFDGHRVIPVELPKLGALDDRGVRALMATERGMYVANNFELRYVDRQGQRQHRITNAGRSVGNLRAMLRLDSGDYAIAIDGSLYRILGSDDAARVESIAVEAWPSGLTVRGVHPGEGALYLSTNAGIFRIELSTRRAQLVEPGVEGLPATAPAAAVFEEPGFLWLGYWNDGLVRIDRASGAARWYRPEPEPGRPRTQSVQGFARGPDGRLLIGTNLGIVAYRDSCDCLSELKSPDWGQAAGQGVIVYHLLSDATGLWASTPQALYRFEASSFAFQYLQKVDDGSGLAGHAVHGLALGEGRLWLAGYGGGTQWIDAPDRDPTTWRIQSPSEVPEGARFVWDVAPGAERSLLATGWGLFALEGGRVQLVQNEVQSLRRLLVENDGVLMGSIGGLHLWRDRVEPVPIHANLSPAVWDLFRDGDTLWVATESGLMSRDGAGRLAHFAAGADLDALPGSTVFRIEIAADGRRWLATSGGLVEWQQAGQDHRFVRQPALIARNIRQVRSLTAMPDGELWLGTPQGIVRFRPPDDVRVFDARDGVLPGQYWPRGSARVGRRVFVANATGVTHFDPAELNLPPLRLQPQALRWRIDDGEWQDGNEVRLRPQQRALAVDFWSGQFAHADDVHYEFSLRGRDSEYRTLGAARELLLEDLRPGQYELMLRAQLRHEPASAREARVLAIAVMPTWYQHPLGKVTLFALALLALYALQRGRERWVRQRAGELQELVEERTAALARANTLLQQQALYDALTGLANRRQLFEYAERVGPITYGLLLIDIDHFKAINDRFGHRVGDRALVAMAQLLQRYASEVAGALAVRNGGEEFVLLLPNVSAEQTLIVAQRLLGDTVAIELRGEFGEAFGMTASIGVALRSAAETIDSAFIAPTRRCTRPSMPAARASPAPRYRAKISPAPPAPGR